MVQKISEIIQPLAQHSQEVGLFLGRQVKRLPGSALIAGIFVIIGAVAACAFYHLVRTLQKSDESRDESPTDRVTPEKALRRVIGKKNLDKIPFIELDAEINGPDLIAEINKIDTQRFWGKRGEDYFYSAKVASTCLGVVESSRFIVYTKNNKFYVNATDVFIRNICSESKVIDIFKPLFNGQLIEICAAIDEENVPFTLKLKELEE